MGKLVAGAVVVVPFPFTNLASSKLRPAVVLATFTRGDVLLCQVTSKTYGHPEVVPLGAADFAVGGPLPRESWVLPHRLVTAHEDVVVRTVGVLSAERLGNLRAAVCRLIQSAA